MNRYDAKFQVLDGLDITGKPKSELLSLEAVAMVGQWSMHSGVHIDGVQLPNEFINYSEPYWPGYEVEAERVAASKYQIRKIKVKNAKGEDDENFSMVSEGYKWATLNLEAWPVYKDSRINQIQNPVERAKAQAEVEHKWCSYIDNMQRTIRFFQNRYHQINWLPCNWPGVDNYYSLF